MLKKPADQIIQLWKSKKRLWTWIIGLFLLYTILLGALAPWLLKRELQAFAQENLKLNLEIEKLRINPYALSLNIENLKLSGPALEKPLGFKQLYINFQVSSLFRLAFSFKEFHLLGVYGDLERFTKNTHSFSKTIANWNAANPTTPPLDSEDSPPPRLWIEDLRLGVTHISFTDHLPKTPFTTAIGPIDLQVSQLSTLPDQTGKQIVEIKTDDGHEIHWSGNLSLSPFTSKGEFSFTGPVLSILSSYLKDQLNFQVNNDELQVNLNYEIAQQAKKPLSIKLYKINTLLTNLEIQAKPETATTPNESNLFHLQKLAINDASLRWPEQQVAIPKIILEQGELWPNINNTGELNFTQLIKPEAFAESDPEPAAAEEAKPWVITNNSLAITDWKIHFSDNTPTRPAALDINNINLHLTNVGNSPEQKVQLSSSLSIDKGTIETEGSLQLFPLANIETKITIAQLPLSPLQPYVESYALVDINSGELNLTSNLHSNASNNLSIDGNIQLDNLKIIEKKTNKKILGWKQFKIENLTADLAANKVTLDKIVFDKAFADFSIAEDGSTTGSRILVTQAEGSSQSANAKKDESTTSEASPELNFNIGKISFKNASGYFADASLPLPFSTKIINLNGNISTIDSSSKTPAKIKLKGQVGQYGQLLIGGNIFPLQPKESTQIKMDFNNLEIPDFSPYAIKFAGRKIATGKLDMDLDYKIAQGKMLGENAIVLREFTLGKRVEQPGAMDLPLDLAIALLKDGEGKINIDLSVKGDVNDPEFGYGKVVGQAFLQLVKNLATAPFKFLANLVGMSNDNSFGKITFEPGSIDISPPQQEALDKLAAAIKDRPNLHLSIPGAYSAAIDMPALQEQVFYSNFSALLKVTVNELEFNNLQHRKTLENLYKSTFPAKDLAEARKLFTVKTSDNNKETFDDISYLSALRDELINAQTITDEQLLSLGKARAQAIFEQLMASSLQAEQATLAEPSAIKPSKKSKVILKMKVASE